jgi:RNA polymerase sigma factor (sigma-70 family)
MALLAAPPELNWDAPRLVEECRKGNEQAWAALIDRYKNLIFSIPIKYGFSRDDAAEIFQQVCVELFSQLGQLRNPQGLAKWLMQVTAHRCFHWRRQQQRYVPEEAAPEAPSAGSSTQEVPMAVLQEAEMEQTLRDSIRQLSPRCRELVRLLFFEEPPRPYQEIAASLGIATGSIGFIRGRCLEKLRAQLEKDGFA